MCGFRKAVNHNKNSGVTLRDREASDEVHVDVGQRVSWDGQGMLKAGRALVG